MRKTNKTTAQTSAPALDATSQMTALVAGVLSALQAQGFTINPPAQASPVAPTMAQTHAVSPVAVAPVAVQPRAVAPVSQMMAQTNGKGSGNKGSRMKDTRAPEGLTAYVGDMARDGRIKLPTALFEGFTRVVLEFPDGFAMAVDRDVEGRARLGQAILREHTKAQSGQYLRFEETHAGYFAVSVVNGIPRETRKAVQPKDVIQPKTAQPVAVAPVAVQPTANPFASLFAQFAQPQTMSATAQTNERKPKRERTQAQKDATARMLAAKAAKEKAKASGVVVNGGPMKPLYVKPETTPKSARPEPAYNVGRSQTQFANGAAQSSLDAVINKLFGK
jgi:hypothetical protein